MSKLKNISSKIKNMSGRKIAIISIICFIVLVPSFIAIFSAIYSEFWITSEETEIKIYDSMGTEIPISSEDDHYSLERIFQGILSDKQPSDKTVAELNGREYLLVSLKNSTGTASAKYYFSLIPNDAVIVLESGEIYNIPSTFNSTFIKTKYAQIFYPASNPTKLLSPELDIITPKTCSWFYKNSADNFIESTNVKLTTDRKTYLVTAPLEFSFGRAPAHCSVKVYEGETIIYQGNLHNLSSLSVNVGTTLRITIDADWIADQSNKSQGRISYDFNAKIIEKFDFRVSTEKINSNDFFILYCDNVTDISKITFDSNVEGYTPEFIRFGDSTVSLIYMPKNIHVDNFTFTIGCGSVTKTFSIKINKTAVAREFSYNNLIFSTSHEPQKQITAVKTLIQQINTNKNYTVYFQGNFLDPTNIGFNLTYSHGSTVKSGDGSKIKYTAFGNEYKISYKSNITYVPSLHSGVVIKTGTDANIGKYVVVDHGCGLKTWYAHLGSITVEEGETVLKGQSLGNLGYASLKNIKGFSLYCSINNEPINPSALLIKK